MDSILTSTEVSKKINAHLAAWIWMIFIMHEQNMSRRYFGFVTALEGQRHSDRLGDSGRCEPEAVDSFIISWGTLLTFIIIKVMEELYVLSLNSRVQAFVFILRNNNGGQMPVHILLLCFRFYSEIHFRHNACPKKLMSWILCLPRDLLLVKAVIKKMYFR